MMSVGLHCRLVGRPGKIAAIRKFIEYIQSHDRVWCPRRIDIAQHWSAHHPPQVSLSPSRMTKDEFVERFGGIFEHSPWIAERAFQLELGPAHDCAAGVHNVLCRMFRSANGEERLGVLKAHPDLAGKLAQAGRLTAESTSEQASAGLDLLTDDERETFKDLNTAYVAKHGFPLSSPYATTTSHPYWLPFTGGSKMMGRLSSRRPATRWNASPDIDCRTFCRETDFNCGKTSDCGRLCTLR
jgi:OHCU decarboxylase